MHAISSGGSGIERVLLDIDDERRELASRFPVPLDQAFPGLYGLEVLGLERDRVQARVKVRDAVRQPMGLVDGGVYAAMAEDMASLATGGTVFLERGQTAVGLSNHTSFLRPISAGWVNAQAEAVHAGRTTWLWEVRFRDDQERLCALSRVTMAVRDPSA
jgi:1,4-dihydroxy-2-naphthoyl-CoA hydrolase